MPDMDGWDWALLAGGGYLAVITLVRLMRRRRDMILEEIRWQAELESRRQRSEEKRKQRHKARQQAQ